MLDSAFTPKVRSKFYKHDRYEGPHSCTSLHSWHWKKLWDCETIWHHANVCQNGCHRHASLWFLCGVTSTCRVFETSRQQVTFILALEVGQIDPGSTAGATLCNTSFGQDKSGIRWTYRHSIVHGWLYLPCPRGASHPVSVTCAMDWHFLHHP